jgi:hypothetical protein
MAPDHAALGGTRSMKLMNLIGVCGFPSQIVSIRGSGDIDLHSPFMTFVALTIT